MAYPGSHDYPGSIDDPNDDTPQISDRVLKLKNSFLRSMGYGAVEPLRGAAQGLYNVLPEQARGALDEASHQLYQQTGGRVGRQSGDYNQFLNQSEAAYQQGEDGGWDWGRMAGNVIGGAPAALLGVPAGIGGAAVVGGAQALLNPVYGPEAQPGFGYLAEKAKQAALGAGTGALLHGTGRSLFGGMEGKPGLDELTAAGVKPTAGQALGGVLDSIEQKASSAGLLLGDAVAASRQSARDQFNKATLDKVVAPIGGEIRNIGHTGIGEAHAAIDGAYAAARDMVGDFVPDIKAAHQAAQDVTQTLSDQGLKSYNRIINGLTRGRQGLTGQTWKSLDSELGNLSATYGRSSLATDKEVGRAVGAFQQGLRSQVSDLFPDAGEAFRRADAAHAQMVRVDRAANAAGLKDGVFTPGQLVNATKAADRSVRRNAFAEGDALLQDWAQAGQRVLGDKYPDSGTPGRILAAGGVLGGMAAYSPSSLVASLALSAGAHPEVQKRLVDLVTRDPSKAEAIIRQLLPYTTGALTGELRRD